MIRTTPSQGIMRTWSQDGENNEFPIREQLTHWKFAFSPKFYTDGFCIGNLHNFISSSCIEMECYLPIKREMGEEGGGV